MASQNHSPVALLRQSFLYVLLRNAQFRVDLDDSEVGIFVLVANN